MDQCALTLLLAIAFPGTTTAQTPPPPPAPTVRVVYIEVASSQVPRATTELKNYREVVQKVPGIVHVEVLQQIGRSNLFAIHEQWGNEEVLRAHIASPENKKLGDGLRSALVSPLDERLLAPISAAPTGAAVSDQSIYVLTHADAAARREEVPQMLQELAAGARREHGNVLFDATVQPTRTNHFTIVEIWANQSAYEAHVTAANARKFRAAFATMSGALYDERIYRRIP